MDANATGSSTSSIFIVHGGAVVNFGLLAVVWSKLETNVETLTAIDLLLSVYFS